MGDYVIGVGSNLGCPSDNLAAGLSLLAQSPEVRLTAVSRIYDTEPVGPPQPRYLNAAIRASSALDAHAVLARLLRIEAALGRARDVRWGPRTLDLDVLWADRPVASEDLRVPHPQLRERSFALAPLLDVAPELAAEYGTSLERLGGAPEVWGVLRLRADSVQCIRGLRAAV